MSASVTRGLPSPVWATLALPYSPIGATPYVASDGMSIETDVLHYLYTALGQDDSTVGKFPYQLTAWGGFRSGYKDVYTSGGGALVVIANAPTGRIKIPAGQSAVAVTCSYCYTSSIVIPILESGDVTLIRVRPTVADGVFTITGNANATADVSVKFVIINTDVTGP